MTLALVISDVDGTLVNKDKKLTDATVVAVARLTAAGIPFSLISARPPSGIMALVEKLALTTPVAAFNGGTVIGPDGAVVERHKLDAEIVRESFAIADGSGATPWLFAAGKWHARTRDNPHVPHEIIASGQEPTIVVGDMTALYDDADKLTWVSDDAPLLRALHMRMDAAIGANATIGQSQTYYLDLTHPKANKGDGVATLARIVRVDLADVAVLGDQANDVPMFARAGLSIAMAQAPEGVRAKARYTSTSNDEDGVAHAIDTILLPMIGEAK